MRQRCVGPTGDGETRRLNHAGRNRAFANKKTPAYFTTRGFVVGLPDTIGAGSSMKACRKPRQTPRPDRQLHAHAAHAAHATHVAAHAAWHAAAS